MVTDVEMQGCCQKEGGFHAIWLLCPTQNKTFKYNHFFFFKQEDIILAYKKHISSRIFLLRNT